MIAEAILVLGIAVLLWLSRDKIMGKMRERDFDYYKYRSHP